MNSTWNLWTMRLRTDHYHHYHYHWGKNENKCFVRATFLYLESYLRNKACLYYRSVVPGCLSILRIHGGNAASYRICDVSATYFWLFAWSTSRNDSSISKEPPSYDSMSWSMDLGYLHLFRLYTECERAYVVTRCSLCPSPLFRHATRVQQASPMDADKRVLFCRAYVHLYQHRVSKTVHRGQRIRLGYKR